MKTPRINPNLLLGIAFSAVFSLAIAQGFDLARLIFGAGPASPWAIAGSVAGLIACSFSARYGLRHIRCHGLLRAAAPRRRRSLAHPWTI